MIDREVMPEWLAKYSPGATFDREAFFSSRVVFYPGSYLDGSAVAFFGRRRLAHCYVYADYGLSRDRLDAALESPGFRGYDSLSRTSLTKQELQPQAVTYHASIQERSRGLAGVEPYALFVVFERQSLFSDEHGPMRFCCVFLYADGHAAFDALFCQSNGAAPYAIVIQDHGFGGNYSDFGSGGLMNQIAERTARLPKTILCAQGSRVWSGYAPVPAENAERGGMQNEARRLYQRDPSPAAASV